MEFARQFTKEGDRMYLTYFENFAVNWIGTNFIVNFAANYFEAAEGRMIWSFDCRTE